jgi:hypothetical protein
MMDRLNAKDWSVVCKTLNLAQQAISYATVQVTSRHTGEIEADFHG